jgi:iron complex outermembrane recepter protein
VAPEDDSVLSAVVVTAQKRVEKVQDVPASVTVASGRQLVQNNITTANDVERLTPNLSGQQSSGRQSRSRWFLRGIGTNDPSLNLESPIGFYQDEVFVAYSLAQTFPLFDLERVEILKGPQGTLWGKNTTGGAIHFISKRPSFEASGYSKGTIGAYGQRAIEGGYGGPVAGEWLAARASFFYEQLEGWATNLRDNTKAPGYSDAAARLQLLANVTNDVDVLLSGRVRTLSGGTNAAYPIGTLPGGVIQQNPMNPETFTPVYGAKPRIKDPFYAGPTTNSLITLGATATVNWHLGNYTLTSISAIDTVDDNSSSYNYQPVLSFNRTGADSKLDSRQISQELRITSPREDRLNWIAGVHYFNWNLYNDGYTGTFGPNAPRKSYVNNRFLQDDISYAGFASATIKATEALSLTLGARYTQDRKWVKEQRLSGTGAPLQFVDPGNWTEPDRAGAPLELIEQSPKRSWANFTYDITPQYKITKDVLAFVRFARGFRAGVFNPTIVPANAISGPNIPRVDPEIVHDLEFGLKSSWFDDRLIANAALFHYWIDNVQLNVQTPNPTGLPNQTGSTVQNAANGTVLGGELELEALPIEALRLRAGLGLIKAEYKDFITYQGTEKVDASGNAFYRVPKFSGSLGASLTLPVTRNTEVGATTDWTIRTKIYHNAVIQNDPVQTTPGYAIGNADLRYIIQKRFTIQAFVKNLTDTSYAVFTSVPSSGAQTANLGAPRTYGLQFIAEI